MSFDWSLREDSFSQAFLWGNVLTQYVLLVPEGVLLILSAYCPLSAKL